MPFWYPANYLKMLNGSDIDPAKSDFADAIIGVNGKLNYKKMSFFYNYFENDLRTN